MEAQEPPWEEVLRAAAAEVSTPSVKRRLRVRQTLPPLLAKASESVSDTTMLVMPSSRPMTFCDAVLSTKPPLPSSHSLAKSDLASQNARHPQIHQSSTSAGMSFGLLSPSFPMTYRDAVLATKPCMPSSRCSTEPSMSSSRSSARSQHVRQTQILLDQNCSIGYHQNSTSAKFDNGRGFIIEVSFKIGDPPTLSQCFVRAYDRSGSRLGREPIIHGTAESLVLLGIHISGNDIEPPFTRYFVYRAGPGIPTIHHVPGPYPTDSELNMVAILPIHNDSEHFAVVFPTLEYFMLETRNHYTLNIYRSDTNNWCKKVAQMAQDTETQNAKFRLLYFQTTNVVYAGAGLIGWVDLWWGILLCNVLDEMATYRFVPFPVPEEWTTPSQFQLEYDFNPRPHRHLAVHNGLIKFIELKFHMDGDQSDNGWMAKIWTRSVSSDIWDEGITVDTSDISASEWSSLNVLPEILDNKKLTWKKIISSAPTLSLHDDLFYIMAKVHVYDPAAFILAVNTKKLTLESCVQCSAERMLGFEATYVPCILPSYFSTTAVSELTEEFKTKATTSTRPSHIDKQKARSKSCYKRRV